MWEEAIESPAPPPDAACLLEAEVIQENLTRHIPIDTAGDWSDVEITFPDLTPRRFWDDLEEDVRRGIRRLFLDGLRSGRIARHQLESLAAGNDREKDDDFVARLLLAFGDLGVQVDDNPVVVEPSWQSAPPGDDYDEHDGNGYRPLAEEAVTFLEDLNSAIGDPFNAYLKDIGRNQLLSRDEETQRVRKLAAQLHIAAKDVELPVTTLSGGNQQKVLLARCLMCSPSVLLMHEPTRGVDVSAKAEIYGILRELAAKGLSIVFTSSEIEETQALAARALVLCQGRISAEFARDQLSDDGLFAAASPSVAAAGIGRPGLINQLSRCLIRCPSWMTAATSTMRSFNGSRPVVSVSMATIDKSDTMLSTANSSAIPIAATRSRCAMPG